MHVTAFKMQKCQTSRFFRDAMRKEFQPESTSHALRHGPGTELASIFAEFQQLTGIAAPEGCTCAALTAEMNALKPDGCRLERDRLVVAVQDNVRKVEWINDEVRDAVVEAMPGFFDEAVVRAEAKAVAQKTNGNPCVPCLKPAKARKKQKREPRVRKPRPRRPSRLHRPGATAASMLFTGPVTRHLVCHVWPVTGSGVWQRNLDELKNRIHVFNGHRRMAIVTDAKPVIDRGRSPLRSDPAEMVKEYVAGLGFEFIELPNNSKAGEIITWEPLLAPLVTDNPNEIVCRVHAKGVRYSMEHAAARFEVVTKWTAAMYGLMLDFMPVVEAQLIDHVFTGPMRREGGFNVLSKNDDHWHYSGAFYWFRSAWFFSRKWRDVPKRYWGVEAIPGCLASLGESACLGPDKVGNLYQRIEWERVEKQVQEWRRQHE